MSPPLLSVENLDVSYDGAVTGGTLRCQGRTWRGWTRSRVPRATSDTSG
jgi:hypothetical protein